MKIGIGLDLGSDTLKIAFAYDQGDGQKPRYGKLIDKDDIVSRSAIPAVAFYDEHQKKWLYGVQIGNQDSFVNVVKIKDLIAMTERKKIKNGSSEVLTDNVIESNTRYYEKEHHFPKFYFPESPSFSFDFDEMVQKKATFVAGDFTPQKVSEGFFAYVLDVVVDRLKTLKKEMNLEAFDECVISILFPASMDKAYVKELERIVKAVFGNCNYVKMKVTKMLTSTKALGALAVHSRELRTVYNKREADLDFFKKNKDESVLIFDMGDESMSVAQVTHVGGGKISIDGIDGHSAPLGIGGKDVDKAIAAYIMSKSSHVTVLGGSTGKEDIVHGKQYLLMQEVKAVKLLLSSESLLKDASQGVAVQVTREVLIRIRLTPDDIKKCIGINKDSKSSLASQVAKYIVDEINLPINRTIKKVILAGGFFETVGLQGFIKEKIKESKRSDVDLMTFDDYCTEDVSTAKGFDILTHEDSVFATAVAGAFVALKNFDISTVLSLSYGTWVGGREVKRLKIFANRGKSLGIDEDKTFMLSDPDDEKSTDCSRISFPVYGLDQEEMYSLPLSKDALKKFMESDEGKNAVEISSPLDYDSLIIGGEHYPDARAKAEAIGLKTVAGGEDGIVLYFHNGRRIRFYDDEKKPDNKKKKPYIDEGIVVTTEGHATPIYKLIGIQVEDALGRYTFGPLNPDDLVKIIYFKKRQTIEETLKSVNNDNIADASGWESEIHEIPAKEIEVRVNLTAFDTQN